MNDARRKRGQIIVELMKQKGFTAEDMEMALMIMKDTSVEKKEKNIEPQIIEETVEKVCKNLNVPDNLFGYKFFVETICSILRNEQSLATLKKQWYPLIGQKNNLPGTSVEKCVQNVVQGAVEKGNHDELNKISDGKITNEEYIKYVVDKVKFELKSIV